MNADKSTQPSASSTDQDSNQGRYKRGVMVMEVLVVPLEVARYILEVNSDYTNAVMDWYYNNPDEIDKILKEVEVKTDDPLDDNQVSQTPASRSPCANRDVSN